MMLMEEFGLLRVVMEMYRLPIKICHHKVKAIKGKKTFTVQTSQADLYLHNWISMMMNDEYS